MEYNYRVCEAYDCEAEGTEFYESDYRNIDFCLDHYRLAIRYNYF